MKARQGRVRYTGADVEARVILVSTLIETLRSCALKPVHLVDNTQTLHGQTLIMLLCIVHRAIPTCVRPLAVAGLARYKALGGGLDFADPSTSNLWGDQDAQSGCRTS